MLVVLDMVLVVVGGGRLPEEVAGACKLVERFTMSFPCTTRLSVDFFRSRVSISSVVLVASSVFARCMAHHHRPCPSQ